MVRGAGTEGRNGQGGSQARAATRSPRPRPWPRPTALGAALGLGLLEASWTRLPVPSLYPNDWLLGVAAIALVLGAASWPDLAWVPGLAIVEEMTHRVAGLGLPPVDYEVVLHHWSAQALGVNLYPYLLFPLLTLLGLGWRLARGVPGRRPDPADGAAGAQKF